MFVVLIIQFYCVLEFSKYDMKNKKLGTGWYNKCLCQPHSTEHFPLCQSMVWRVRIFRVQSLFPVCRLYTRGSSRANLLRWKAYFCSWFEGVQGWFALLLLCLWQSRTVWQWYMILQKHLLHRKDRQSKRRVLDSMIPLKTEL